MKPGAEGGSLYVPGAGHFECRLTSYTSARSRCRPYAQTSRHTAGTGCATESSRLHQAPSTQNLPGRSGNRPCRRLRSGQRCARRSGRCCSPTIRCWPQTSIPDRRTYSGKGSLRPVSGRPWQSGPICVRGSRLRHTSIRGVRPGTLRSQVGAGVTGFG